MITCPKCKRELKDGTKFCINCGAKIFETIFCYNCGRQISTEFDFCPNCGAPVTAKPANGGPNVRPAAVFKKKRKLPKKTAAILIFSGGNKAQNDYAFYVKDNEIFFTDLKEGSEPWQVTSELGDGDFYQLGLWTYVSEDGKYIFFPDKTDDENYRTYYFDLYYKEAAKPEVQAVLIDSDIGCYTVNASSTLITYLKSQGGGGGILYQYKIGKGSTDRIASDVRIFATSGDGRKIVYLDSEGNIYVKQADNEKEMIAGGVSSVEYVTEDFTTVYYIEDESLYKWVEGEDLVKIDSGVCDTVKIYETGEIYYATSDAQERYSLCFYNGSEKTVTADNLYYNAYDYDIVCASETPIILYKTFNHNQHSYDLYIAVKGNSTIVQQEEATNLRINDAGTAAYYIDDIRDGKNYGTLYRIDISNGVVGRPKVYDSEVYSGNLDGARFVSDSVFVYFKDYNDYHGDLYINKNKVDDSVRAGYFFDSFYYTDFNHEEGFGTLKFYNGEEAVWVADNVNNYIPFNGRVVYYTLDYDYDQVELYEWSDGKTRKIDDDVAIIYCHRSLKFRGNLFTWEFCYTR